MELIRGTLSRRGFIARSVAGMSAMGLPVWFAKEVVATEEHEQAQQQPNDAIVMGHIGCGSQGRSDSNAARRLPGVRYVAVCDVDRGHRQQFANTLATPTQPIAQFNDFRELLARKDINAVTISVPDHWHAIIAIAAMKAGKDVHCQKPLSLTIEEGKTMVRVARETNKVFQTGSQQRTEFRGLFRLACDLVRNERVGHLDSIECRLGNPPRQGPFAVTPVPEGLDWNFWVGPTPICDYVRQKCFDTFRWWYEYSGGKMTDWGAHMLDIAQWAMNMDESGPTEVEATGEAFDPPFCYNTHRNFKVTYKYANGVTVRAVSTSPEGVRFNGQDGKWINVTRSNITASDPHLLDALPNNAPRLPAFNSHMGNFISCVRSRQRPIADVAIGYRSVSVCHIGNIALRTGEHLHWSPEREQFTGNDRANLWLSRPMRAPWKLEA